MGSPLKLPRTIIAPSGGDLYVNCIRCGGRTFRPHVRPQNDGTARLTYLECATCKKLFEIDDHSRLAGKANLNKPKEKAQ